MKCRQTIVIYIDKQLDRQIGWMDECGSMNVWIDRKINRLINRQRDGQIDRQGDRWMDQKVYKRTWKKVI